MKNSPRDTKSSARLQQIFENLIFLEQVFLDSDDDEISNIAFLELARCFELTTGGRKAATAH